MAAVNALRKEQAIREHAYHLWEQDGRPHGRDVEFWERAAQDLAALSKRSGRAAVAGKVKAADKPAKVTAPRLRTSAPKRKAERTPKA